MRSRIDAAVVAAGLLAVRAAGAQNPCAEDVKQFCADVRVGGGRVENCLQQNEARLSPACKEKRAAAESRFRSLVEEFGVACQRDISRLCSKVKEGNGRVLACLIRQQDDLSSSCQAETDRYQTASEKVATVRAACKADVERLCAGVQPGAGPLVECIQENRGGLSETCRAADPAKVALAAELVDAVDALSSAERIEESQRILQGVDSIAFSRSQILLQVDNFRGLFGVADADRLLLNPQLVFGRRNEFAVQVKAPIFTVYPYAPDHPARTGLGSITTAFAWAFFGTARIHQYASLGLQWKSAAAPPIGAAWAVIPSYALSASVARWLSITGQFAFIRSFASSGYPELNVLLLDPIIVANLPGRSFVVLDTKLGWNLVDGSFVPSIKGVGGIYINRQRSLSISAWYQTALSSVAKAQLFTYGVGAALAYFFDW